MIDIFSFAVGGIGYDPLSIITMGVYTETEAEIEEQEFKSLSRPIPGGTIEIIPRSFKKVKHVDNIRALISEDEEVAIMIVNFVLAEDFIQ